MTAAISFIVTCKGRLRHLKQTLPGLIAQPNSEVIVVDYDCPDGTSDWVRSTASSVRIVKVTDAPRFNYSHAHNLGARTATAPWLCFVDADILVAPEFSGTILPLLRSDHYFRPVPLDWNAYGSFVCARTDFEQAGGYDEVIEGWGGKDDDLYRRLEMTGRRLASFPGTLFLGLKHDDESRTRHYEIKDRLLNQRLNSFYLHVKYDLLRQLGMSALSRSLRQSVYREIKRTFLDQGRADPDRVRVELSLPDRIEVPILEGWSITRKWVFEMAPESGTLAPKTSSTFRAISEYLDTHSVHKLQLGCGQHPLPGWLNTDLSPTRPDILRIDAGRPLPFHDESMDFVFSEHLIEHMPYPQGCALLAECQRILKRGGILRIATPDLAFLINLYRSDKSDLQMEFLNWSKERFLPWAPFADDAFVINNAVRDWGHQFIYDEKTLRQALAKTGFLEIRRQPLMHSEHAALRGLENDARKPPGLLAAETVVVEASKP